MREKNLLPLPCNKVTNTTTPTSATSSSTIIPPISSLAPPTSNNSIKTAALQSGILADNDSSAIQSFDDDENEWELGVGNLIIDLDADLEKNEKDPILPDPSPVSGPGMEHQATVDKGLKMKIKRKKETANSNNSNKHEIVREKMSANDSKDQNKVSPPDTKTNKRTVKKDKGAKDSNKKDALSNGFTHEGQTGQVKSEDPYEFNAKVEDRISVPVKKIKVEKGATPPGSPPGKPAPFSVPEPQPAPSCLAPAGLMTQTALQGATGAPHSAVAQKDASTETQDSGTITEPDCLGPCEPGTSVTLEGIVWQETENGVLVVNVTWRGKTYVGTLLDATRHDWAPPRFNCESPTSESPKGRGVKRNCRGSVSSTPVDNVIETRKLRKGRRGARSFQAPPSPAKSDITPVSSAKRKPRPSDLDLSTDDLKNKQRCRSNSRGTPTEPEPKPNAQGYIECPEPNCSKKYKHINGLRYHQSHAHGAPESSESKSSNDSSESRPPTPATPSGKDVKRTKTKEKEVKEAKKESEKESEGDDEKNKNKDKSKKAKGASDSNQKPGDPTLPKEKKNKHKKKKDREKERSKSPKGAKEDSCNEVKSVISDSGSAVKVPSTPQVGEGEELAADSVHSPAYSDISDAAESAPTTGETDNVEKPAEGKPAEVAAGTSEPAKSSTPNPSSTPFNMYSYYGQPPYLIPTMASKSQQNSPNTTPKPDNPTPTEPNKVDKPREEQKDQKEKETAEAVPALYPSGQPPLPVLTAYGYIDPAYHTHLLNSDPRYRETHEKFLEKQKQAKAGAKKDGKDSPSLPVDHSKPKETVEAKEGSSSSSNSSSKPAEKPRDVPEAKPTETRIKTEPLDTFYERHQEDLKRFYLYQQKQQEHKPEDQHSRHEEDRRAVMAIKQEPKSVIEHRPREPEKNTSVIKEPIPAAKPDLKRAATPQDKAQVQEKRAKLDRVSPATTPKTSKPSTPTMIPAYGQYAVPPGFIQASYGQQIQLDPHGPYRGVGVLPTIGYQPHPSPYMHPAMRYHHLSPMEKEKQQLLMSPGGRHPSLPEPPKALDLLQQHASHYYNSTQQQHKIHELEKAARPDAVSPSTKPRTDNSPVPVAKAKDLSMNSGRPVSPPPQRHVHTHHHTHLVGGYPIYDPYGAIINPGQSPANLPPGAMGHPFPPK